MKKLLKRLKIKYLNRIIAFIIMELFIISIVPVNADDLNNNNKKDTKYIIRNIKNNIKDRFKMMMLRKKFL